jgi:hypothetical protein
VTDVAGGSHGQGLGPSDPPPATKAALPVVIGVVVLFAILVVVVWQTGVFDKDTSASDAQIVAAMLTLLGGLIASAFTLVGVLLKHSIDRHSARLAVETEHRRRLEAQEVENRLRLETSIKAVELLTLPDGTPAPSGRQAGALYVLGSDPLEQLDLAVALLNEHWRDGMISSIAAIWIVDRALTRTDPDLQRVAADTLSAHADLLPRPDGSDIVWPDCANLTWPIECSYFARTALLHACAKALASRRPQQWEKGVVNWFIVQFDRIRRMEEAPEINSGAILVLNVLLDWYRRQDPAGSLHLPEGRLELSALREELAPRIEPASLEVSEQLLLVIQKLAADWSEPQSSAAVAAPPPSGADPKPSG